MSNHGNKKILIVEDDADVSLGYQVLLRAHRFDTVVAADFWRRGVAAIQQHRPHADVERAFDVVCEAVADHDRISRVDAELLGRRQQPRQKTRAARTALRARAPQN